MTSAPTPSSIGVTTFKGVPFLVTAAQPNALARFTGPVRHGEMTLTPWHEDDATGFTLTGASGQTILRRCLRNSPAETTCWLTPCGLVVESGVPGGPAEITRLPEHT